MKIAYITYSGAINYTAANNFNENHDLLPFLQEKGLDIHSEIWDDPNVDWESYDVAVLKSPWDYHRKFEAFNSWLEKLQQLNVVLLNDYDTIRWNMDKHYLKEIADAGLAIIPSLFPNLRSTENINILFDELATEKLIIKPCVSGGSANTFVLTRDFSAQQAEEIIALSSTIDLIAQPFLEEINAGEWSFIFFNSSYSHTILKKPAADDFRVQQMFGGTIEVPLTTQHLIDTAEAYVREFAKDTLYARVDGVMVNGTFQLMELELVEPFLYLSYDSEAVAHYYEALVQRLAQLG